MFMLNTFTEVSNGGKANLLLPGQLSNMFGVEKKESKLEKMQGIVKQLRREILVDRQKVSTSAAE